MRIQPVGTVELRDANRPLQAGDAVYKAQCAACHDAGLAGAPKFADASAWAPRIGSGYEALLNSVLNGKGAMGAQGGGAFSDVELGRAVVHMVNAAGGNFPVPEAPAAAPAEQAAAAPAESAPAAAPAAAPVDGSPPSVQPSRRSCVEVIAPHLRRVPPSHVIPRPPSGGAVPCSRNSASSPSKAT